MSKLPVNTRLSAFTQVCAVEEDQKEEEEGGDVNLTCQHLFVSFTETCAVEEDQENEEEGGDVNRTCQHLFVSFTETCVVEEDQKRKRKVEMLILPVNTCLSALRRCVCGGGRPAGGRGRWRC